MLWLTHNSTCFQRTETTKEIFSAFDFIISNLQMMINRVTHKVAQPGAFEPQFSPHNWPLQMDTCQNQIHILLDGRETRDEIRSQDENSAHFSHLNWCSGESHP